MGSDLHIEMLSDDPDAKKICERYWKLKSRKRRGFLVTVRQLAKELDVTTKELVDFVKLHSRAYIPDWDCDSCNKRTYFESRAQFFRANAIIRKKRKSNPYCIDCRDKRSSRPVNATPLDDHKKEMRIQSIRQRFSHTSFSGTNMEEVSFSHMVYLSTLLSKHMDNESMRIPPIAFEPTSQVKLPRSGSLPMPGRRDLNGKLDQILTPTFEFSTEIMTELYDSGLIGIHPDADPASFFDDSLQNFDPMRMLYTFIPTYSDQGSPLSLKDYFLMRVDQPWPEQWQIEALNLWKRIAIEECKQFLTSSLASHGFQFKPGNDIHQSISLFLENHSIAQAFAILWRSACDADSVYQTSKSHRTQSALYSIAAFRQYAKRSELDGWEISPRDLFARNDRSLLSNFFFDSVLQLGDKAYTTVPNTEALSTLVQSFA